MSLRSRFVFSNLPIVLWALATSSIDAADKTTGRLLEEVQAEQPGFLSKAAEERQVLAGKIRAEVENALNYARRIISENPTTAEQDLKVVLAQIENVPDLDAEIRSQLQQQLGSAVRQARRVAVEVAARRQAEGERVAAAQEQERINAGLETKQLRLKQLMDRFDSLLDERRYDTAIDDVAPEVQRLAPDTSVANAVVHGGQMMRAKQEIDAVTLSRDKNFVQATYSVEQSFVPFPDEPPIVYMPADKWDQLARKREKNKVVDLGKQSGAEQKIVKELNSTTEISFIESPLKDVVSYLRDKHGISIEFNTKAIIDAGVNPDAPVTKDLKNITLRSALRLLLNGFDLTYVVRDEVLMITSHEDAQGQLSTKVYPVGDLVVPIGNFSSLGGLGGGGFGGGAQGGGGGFGVGGFGVGQGNGIGNAIF